MDVIGCPTCYSINVLPSLTLQNVMECRSCNKVFFKQDGIKYNPIEVKVNDARN